MPAHPSRPVIAGLALVGALAFAGIGSHQGDTVLVIGDSITKQATDHIHTELLGDGWQPVVEGRSGSSIVEWTDEVDGLVAVTDPDVVVVELGTNDREPPAVVAEGVDAVMRPLRTVPRVIWLNVQNWNDSPQTAAINEVLRQATIRWPNLEILDFWRHFTDTPEWHSTDPVHLNEAGSAELARFIRQALDAPPSPVRTLTAVV